MNVVAFSAQLAILCMLSNVVAAQAAPPESLLERDWSVNAVGSLRDSPASAESVKEFIATALNQPEGETINVCSSAFVDIAGSGQYDLIASLDYTGRMFCNDIAVFSKTGSRVQVQHVVAWEVDNVAHILHRIESQGNILLVIPEAFSPYQGAKCVATAEAIYSMRGNKLIDTSVDHPEYYHSRLARLDRELTANPDNEGASCKLMEADKIKRRLGISQNAGFQRALEWSRSPDPDLRSKAASVFADIHDQASIEQLKMLLADHDASVSVEAMHALGRK